VRLRTGVPLPFFDDSSTSNFVIFTRALPILCLVWLVKRMMQGGLIRAVDQFRRATA
jgi:hypothetical protein